jgi:hypothetical protein
LEVHGTRFRLYPQAPLSSARWRPEIVWVSAPVGTVLAGPSDDRMYVVDAVQKDRPYDLDYLPPYRGARNPPVPPGPDGHFDHLEPGTRAFMAAHMYGTIRFVLDVWERYRGGEIPWHFTEVFDRLELVPVVDWDNAQCGYGYIETGFARMVGIESHPFCLDFDVLAHELGHALIYSLLGLPPPDRVSAEYLGFHESAADCAAMIAVLHFDSVVEDLLRTSRGNIYLPNELNRIGELSDTEQFRIASHSLTLADVPDVRTPVAALTQRDRHTIGLPLTGAVFDILVEVFQELLVEDGVISRELDELSRGQESPVGAVQAGFDRSYAGRHDAFKAALLDARDYVGRLLADAWRQLSWDVTFNGVAAAMLTADGRLMAGVGRNLLIENLARRGIEIDFRAGRPSYSGTSVSRVIGTGIGIPFAIQRAAGGSVPIDRAAEKR